MATRRDIGTDDPRVKVRPGRGSRPRTRIRPDYSQAPSAFVFAVNRGRYDLALPDGTRLQAVKARELGRHAIVVGDQVKVVGDLSGKPGTLARIVQVEARHHLLRRTPEDGDAKLVERPLVANAQVMVIVAALEDPPPRPRLIDRILVAAHDGDMEAMLVLTKADLAAPSPFIQNYANVGVSVIATYITPQGVDEAALAQVKHMLQGRTSVLVGHSGVGKSTLINQLVPTADRQTGHVNQVTGRGRHTSTSVAAFALPGGGWIVDTPGIRSFGLAHINSEELLAGFVDLWEASRNCPRGCSHRGDSPDCYLDEWARGNEFRQGRLESFRRLLDSRVADYS